MALGCCDFKRLVADMAAQCLRLLPAPNHTSLEHAARSQVGPPCASFDPRARWLTSQSSRRYVIQVYVAEVPQTWVESYNEAAVLYLSVLQVGHSYQAMVLLVNLGWLLPGAPNLTFRRKMRRILIVLY
jgi:hypothetical protein